MPDSTPSQLTAAAADQSQETPAAATQATPGAFAPFRSPIFLSIWVASLVSNFGSLIQNVGAAWLMTSLAGSADMVALVQVSTVLPIMLFSLPAGAAADVWDRRLVMLAALGGMFVVSVALAVLSWIGVLSPWTLIGITFLLGVGGALYGPAWQSSVREMVPRTDLPAAVALNSVAYNLARAAGPAVGGILVAWAGAKLAFTVNAASYLGLIAVLLLWRRPAAKAELPPEGVLSAMLAGLRFARLSHALQAVLARSAIFGFFASALWALVPLVARDLLGGGAVTYGLLLAAFGGGAVAGALFGAGIRQRTTNEWIVAGGSLLFGAAGLVVAYSPFAALTLPAMAAAGAAWLLALSTFNVTVQLRSPRWVVGRAMAIYQAGVFGGLALGAWLWGVAAEHYSVSAGLLAAALGLGASALLGRVLPMPATDQINVEPAPADPDFADSQPRLEPESGPVVASTEYRVSPRSARAFLAAARRLRRMRGRNGARRWLLLHDASDPEIWVERYETPTWLDHLRVRRRMTVIDREIEDEITAFHQDDGPPVTRYLLAHVPPESASAVDAAGRHGQAAFDASLPPAMSASR